MKTNLVHLVILSFGSDLFCRVVGPKTLNFIESKFDSSKGNSSYIEVIPQDVQDELNFLNPDWLNEMDAQFEVCRSRCDNDRALAIASVHFDSVSEAISWTLKKGFKLGREYHGTIY